MAGTIAVFVVALGLGMPSMGVVIFGIVLLVLAIALGSVNVVRRGARAWVAGTAEVRSISPPPTSAAVYGRARIMAVVVAPGLPTSEVELNESKVPVVKWPSPGDTLPITVDVDDMRRVRINWNEAVPGARGEDPPPPAMPDYDDFEAQADDDDAGLLDDFEPPPWKTRDRQWGRGPDEPPPPPPPSASPPPPGLDDTTVVVRDTPAGPVVEGEFVDHDDTPQTLPRRAQKADSDIPTAAADSPAPSPTAATASSPTASSPTASSATASSPTADSPTAATADSPTVAATAGAAAAGAAAGAASTPGTRRPSAASPSGTRRPSPHPHRAATATADPNEAFTPTAGPEDAFTRTTAAPTQREPHPDDEIATDIPLDDPPPPHRPEPVATSTQATPSPVATSAPATPSPVSSFPTAPPPSTPPPTAPAPSTPRPAFDDEIDLPLDGNPEPAPETTPHAAAALQDDLIAPPAETISDQATPIRSSTRFVTNAAHDATSPSPDAASSSDATPSSDTTASSSGTPSPDATASSSGTPSPDATASSSGTPSPDATASSGVVDDPGRLDEDVAAVPWTPEPDPEPTPARAAEVPQAPEPSRVAAVPVADGSETVGARTSEAPSEPEAKHGLLATAVGAVAAAAVAAVKKAGRNDPDRDDRLAEGPATESASAGAAPVPEPPAARPPAPAAAAAAAPDLEGGPAPQPQKSAPPAAVPVSAEDAAEQAGARPPAPAAASAGAETGAVPRGHAPSPAAAALAEAAAAAAAGSGGKSPWAGLGGAHEPDESAADLITAYPSARPGPAGAIHGVGITVLVTDLGRSVGFYRDTLGFYEIDHGEGSAVLASGDTRLVLRTVHGLSAEAGRLIYLNLEVGDVEAVYEELRAKGVEFVHAPRPVNRGDRLELWSASFRDPDDHNIAITQWRAIH
ncbi:VOC family protein [Paractinoplanes atraurantiacus]|uniref:VOC family protein n=1 Tax=Paractinoplanes atraurantiacus TaxID=1036182 RepID=UPI003F68CD09